MKYHAGELIYKYELRSYIGGGAFGEVWLAKDNALDSQCALKLLPRNDTSIDERLCTTLLVHYASSRYV